LVAVLQKCTAAVLRKNRGACSVRASRARWFTPAGSSFGVLSGLQRENSTMLLKLTTNQRAEIWVNLNQVMQMTTISVQDGYPSTEIIMANGVAITVHEKPVDIANWTKGR
jgi:hypothetical protein